VGSEIGVLKVLDSGQVQDFRTGEIFSSIRLSEQECFFLRLDGRRFNRLSQSLRVNKPYDVRFAKCLVAAAKAIFALGFVPTLAYVCSDEINVLFSSAQIFGGRVEKINSVLASTVSSGFTLAMHEEFKARLPVSFDSRIVTPGKKHVLDYLIWRQRESMRNHLNSYAHWTLRKHGLRVKDVSQKTRGLEAAQIRELLHSYGVSLSRVPLWEKMGILVFREPVTKVSEVGLKVTRMRFRENWKLPLFSSKEGRRLLRSILAIARINL